MDAPEGVYWAMGSIMVLPGCTAYLFYDHNYEGDRLEECDQRFRYSVTALSLSL